jgi:phosphate starvation-inducible membrane PsiE
MPVTCLIYIAITALSRMLIGDIQTHHQIDMELLIVSAAILLLAISTRLIRNPPSNN